MIRQNLPKPIRRAVKSAAEFALPILEAATGFRTARGDYLPNRFRILLRRYEGDELRLIQPFVQNARVIFDVGANVGYVSRFFAKTKPAGARLFSFEPNPIIFPILSRNLAHLPGVRVLNFGLSNADSEMPLFLAGNNYSVGSFSNGYPATHAVHQELKEVHSVTAKLAHGDSFAAHEGIAQIDAMKVDVEGWELNVLTGLEQTVERSPHIAIFCEYNAAAQKCAGRAPEELPAWFLERGFTLSVEENGALRPLPGTASALLAALPSGSAYPTLFATRG